VAADDQEVHLMTSTGELRPVERRVLRWAETGLTDAEIGQRFGRGERWVEQVRTLAAVDRPASGVVRTDPLRPLERRLLRWREQGLGLAELGTRFRRSPEFLARVEGYAQYKLGML
jgi:DNA-binding CsgD family transcriptional regulator